LNLGQIVVVLEYALLLVGAVDLQDSFFDGLLNLLGLPNLEYGRLLGFLVHGRGALVVQKRLFLRCAFLEGLYGASVERTGVVFLSVVGRVELFRSLSGSGVVGLHVQGFLQDWVRHRGGGLIELLF